MSTTEITFPPEVCADLQDTISAALTGQRDREAMRKAVERMNRIREDIRRRHGVLDIGVPAIRELRDE